MIYLVSQHKNAFELGFTQISVEASINLLRNLPYIGLDSETTGLDCHTDKMLLLQLGCYNFQIVYDIGSFGGKIPQILKDFMMEPTRHFILQNAKFDIKFLYKQEIVIEKVYDTFLAEQIITHGLQLAGRSLDVLVQKYYPDQPGLDKSIRNIIISNKRLTSEIITYAANDVKYLEGIKDKQLPQIEKLELEKAVELDNLFVRVLAYVEFNGMKLDWDKWKQKSLKDLQDTANRKTLVDKWVIDNGYSEYTTGMMDLFSGEATCNVNWDSQKQVIPLFEKIGIKCEVVDKGVKKKSIDAKKVLALQKNDFQILPLYLDYKESVTQTTTFGLNWEKYINSNTGRVHSVFRQIQDTGRMASGERGNAKSGYVGAPNFQNLPAGVETRSCFVAEPGCRIISADYSSQEQRILANFSKVETLLNFYKKGFTDMHSYVAFLMYPDIRPCSIEDITNDTLIYIKKNYKKQRDLAKNAGFAINYGGNGATISKNTGIPPKQGEFVYNAYFEAFGGLKEYFWYVLEKTKRDGYIQFNNVTKRKFFVPFNSPLLMYKDIVGTDDLYQFPNPRAIEREYSKAEADFGRLSQNYPIQGTAADMTKLACIIFFNTIIKKDLMFDVKLINIVHDEILVECKEEIAEEMSDLLVKSMEKAGDMFCQIIPLTADAEIGTYWIH